MNRSILMCAGNSGIGLAVIERMLAAGDFAVHATFRNDSSPLEEAYERAGLDPSKYVHRLDLTDGPAVLELMTEVDLGGDLWGLVNFAGVVAAQRLEKMSFQEATEVFVGNSLSALTTTQAALKHFAGGGSSGGRVVQTSSVLTRRPVVGAAPYAAGKSAIEGLVRSSALEAGRSGVTVNCIRLGYYNLGMTAHVPQVILDDVVRSTSSRRLGEAGDLTALLKYLLADDSSFMTGKILELDGGLE